MGNWEVGFNSGLVISVPNGGTGADNAVDAKKNLGIMDVVDLDAGAWVPVVRSSNDLTPAEIIHSSNYVRQGKIVYFTTDIVIMSPLAVSGDLIVDGLPFPSSPAEWHGAFLSYSLNFVNVSGYLTAMIKGGASFLRVNEIFNGNTGGLDTNKVTVNTRFIVSGIYSIQ